MAVCMAGALDITISPLAESPAIEKALLPGQESVSHFLLSRRSIRTYKKKIADRETLKNILEISRYAPSAHNRQPVHWLMVETPEEVQRLAGIVVDYMTEIKEFCLNYVHFLKMCVF